MSTAHAISMQGLLGREVEIDGTPTSGEALCYAYAREVLKRIGVDIPSDPAALHAERAAIAVELGESEVLAAGDVLVIRDRKNGQHLGVCVNGFQVAHYADDVGGVLMRIAVLARSGLIASRCRPRSLMGVGAQA